MRDELTDEQRARLCILEAVQEIAEVELDALDVLRCCHWVEAGGDPDQPAAAHAVPDVDGAAGLRLDADGVRRHLHAAALTRITTPWTSATWAPAVR